MTHFIKQGSEFIVTDSANMDIRSQLPAGTFVVLFNPEKGGFYLNEVAALQNPYKLYGSTQRLADRVFTTFEKRTANTGLLLNGEKGSGKTLTMRTLGIKFFDHGMPTLIINSQFVGDVFNKFLTSIGQPCMVAFDEFDKNYDDEHQQQILTLLDGMFTSKKLFVFTCNDSYKINKHMLNRPGRIFYNIKFRGIEEEAIRGYCADELRDPQQLDSVLRVAATIDAFNFDMLKGLVEEMNRYNEDAISSVQFMNIRPESSNYIQYNCEIAKPDDQNIKSIKVEHYNCESPLTSRQDIHFRVYYKEEIIDSDNDSVSEEYLTATLGLKNLTSQDIRTGEIVMVKDGYRFIFTRERQMEYHYGAF